MLSDNVCPFNLRYEFPRVYVTVSIDRWLQISDMHLYGEYSSAIFDIDAVLIVLCRVSLSPLGKIHLLTDGRDT